MLILKTLKRLPAKPIAGVLVTALLIGVSLMAYPLTGNNFSIHLLMLAMSAVIGLNIALPAMERLDNWAIATNLIYDFKEEKKQSETVSLEIPDRAGTEYAPMGRVIKPVNPIVLAAPIRGGMPTSFGQRNGQQEQAKPESRIEFIKFASQNPICSLATVDDNGEPRVRRVFLWRTDSKGFYFVLFSPKNVSRQVKNHPRVEICFHNNPTDLTKSRQMRVSGDMKMIRDENYLKQAASERSLLNKLAGEGDDSRFEVYHMTIDTVQFWDMVNLDSNPMILEQLKKVTV